MVVVCGGGACWCASESCSERRSSSSPAAVKSSVRCAASAAWSDTWRRASASAARIDSSWDRLICSVASDEESASALAREPSASCALAYGVTRRVCGACVSGARGGWRGDERMIPGGKAPAGSSRSPFGCRERAPTPHRKHLCHVSRAAVRERACVRPRHAHLRPGGGELSVRVLDALGASVQLDHGEVELLRSVVTLSLGVASGDIRSRDFVGCGC